MERISKKPTPDCPLCGWSRKDHPMATHEWVRKTGECAGEDREPCLLRQLAAANERAGRLEEQMGELRDAWQAKAPPTSPRRQYNIHRSVEEFATLRRILGGS